MSNSKEKKLKLKGIHLRKDSDDMKNLASIMPQTSENIEQSSLGKYSTGVPEAIQINPNLEKDHDKYIPKKIIEFEE